MADFYGDAEESSASGKSRVLRNMRKISQRLGCVVMGSGHTGHGSRDDEGNETPPERQRGTSRFRQAWDFELMATGTQLLVKKEREAERIPPVPYRVVKRLDSLAVVGGGTAASGGFEFHEWPHPATEAQLDRLVSAIRMTPGLGVNAIAKAARMRKDDVPIVIAKAAEGGLIVPDGGRSPKWRVN